jgi:hypothetical protein
MYSQYVKYGISSLLLGLTLFNLYNTDSSKLKKQQNKTTHTKHTKQRKKKNNYNYDLINLSKGVCHYRTNIIHKSLKKIYTSDPIYVLIHETNNENNYLNNINSFNNIIKKIYNYNIKLKNSGQSGNVKYIVFDLYNSGHSRTNEAVHDTSGIHVGQLCELLYSLNITSRINLVGYGDNYKIALDFQKCFPNKIVTINKFLNLPNLHNLHN